MWEPHSNLHMRIGGHHPMLDIKGGREGVNYRNHQNSGARSSEMCRVWSGNDERKGNKYLSLSVRHCKTISSLSKMAKTCSDYVYVFACLWVCIFVWEGVGGGVNCRNSEIIKILQQDVAVEPLPLQSLIRRWWYSKMRSEPDRRRNCIF